MVIIIIMEIIITDTEEDYGPVDTQPDILYTDIDYTQLLPHHGKMIHYAIQFLVSYV